MLRSENDAKDNNANDNNGYSHAIFEAPYLLDIIFNYISPTFFSIIPPSLMASKDMKAYSKFLRDKENAIREQLSILIEGKKREIKYQQDAKIKLAQDIEKVKKEYAELLHQAIANLELKYKKNLNKNEVKEKKTAQPIQQALLSKDNFILIVAELIKDFEDFERLCLTEINNLSFWSRITIDRDDNYGHRILMSATLFLAVSMASLAILICSFSVVLKLSMLFAPMLLIFFPYSMLNYIVLTSAISGLLCAAINGIFKYDFRSNNERFNEKPLESLSPAVTSKFSEIKATESIFIDNNSGESLSSLNMQSTIINVRDAFQKSLTFFNRVKNAPPVQEADLTVEAKLS